MVPALQGPGTGRLGGVAIGAGWLAKAAFPLLLGIIALWMVVTSWIHYPEIVKARAVITRSGNAGDGWLVDIDAPQNNWFRIDSGQSVQLQFDDYPYTRVGYARGALGRVLHSEGHRNVTARLYLPAGLTTSRDSSIPFRPEMKADILITIKDMMLFQRIFYNSAKKTFH